MLFKKKLHQFNYKLFIILSKVQDLLMKLMVFHVIYETSYLKFGPEVLLTPLTDNCGKLNC